MIQFRNIWIYILSSIIISTILTSFGVHWLGWHFITGFINGIVLSSCGILLFE